MTRKYLRQWVDSRNKNPSKNRSATIALAHKVVQPKDEATCNIFLGCCYFSISEWQGHNQREHTHVTEDEPGAAEHRSWPGAHLATAAGVE